MDAFKQPQLGQTIVNLRQEKKLTQEELVERCNLNVRTLQRIEAGEVTPRDYTIRAIFSALEYEFQTLQENYERTAMRRKLQLAWISGIVYFLIGFAEVIMDNWRFEGPPAYFPLLYTTVKLLILVSFVCFMLGFVESGKYFKNALVRISAYLMLGSMAVIELYDILSVFSDMDGKEFMMIKGFEAVAFGGIDIVFGIALIQLRKVLGTTALLAGILEIIIGFFFLTFFLAFFGLFVMIPAILLEIIVLYKVYDMMQPTADASTTN